MGCNRVFEEILQQFFGPLNHGTNSLIWINSSRNVSLKNVFLKQVVYSLLGFKKKKKKKVDGLLKYVIFIMDICHVTVAVLLFC